MDTIVPPEVLLFQYLAELFQPTYNGEAGRVSCLMDHMFELEQSKARQRHCRVGEPIYGLTTSSA